MGAWPASSGRVPVAIARKSSQTGLDVYSPVFDDLRAMATGTLPLDAGQAPIDLQPPRCELAAVGGGFNFLRSSDGLLGLTNVR